MISFLICFFIDAVLLISFLVATATTFAAWVYRANQPSTRPTDDEEVAPNLTAIIAWLWQFVIVAGMCFGYPVGIFWGSYRRQIPGHRPIILIHGYAVNRIVWMYIRRRLVRDGYRNIETVNMATLSADVETCQHQIRAVIDRVLSESGESQVDLIGHSLGGLIAVSTLLGLSDGKASTAVLDDRVRRVVSIAAPLAGTQLAFLGLGAAAKQMRPGAAYLQEFAKAWKQHGVGSKAKPGAAARVTTLVSSFDNMVIPWESGQLDGAHTETFAYLGHDAMLASAQVYEAIRVALEAPETTAGSVLAHSA